MRDAAVDKLTKLIADKPKYKSNHRGSQPSKAPHEVHIGLAEGWFSLVMLAIVVYSTVWCVQAAGWVDHLNILTVTTGVGLIFGVAASKQHRFPRLAVHIVVLCVGLLLAFWQTVGAFYQGHAGLFITSVQHWLSAAFAGQTGNDDSIFLFFILSLGFVLAYVSAWFVYRTRNPWLAILANAVVLLINLSSVDAGYIFFLVIFLMASLLLLLRFNLYESLKRWRKQGLRYPDDIGWDVMQAGAIISVCILIFSWILPGTYTNDVAAQIWNSSSNPWQQAENTWNRIISLNGGVNPSNHGNFRDSLALGGNPNLNHDIVLTVDSSDGSMYYETLSYDTYDAHKSSWSNGSTETLAWHANDTYSPDAITMVHAVTQKITIVSPLSEQYAYILGTSEIGAYNANATVMRSKSSGSVVAWLNKSGNLGAGSHYDITSYVSSADVQTLRGVPMPASAPPPPPPEYEGQQDPNVYSKPIVDAYTQLPSGLDPRILAKSKQVVNDVHATTMYDKVVALESYFRNNYSYSTDIQLPPGEEGVSWFLFDNSSHKGFCNYFSTSMVVMARSLGIPARVVAGYTNGDYDSKTHQRVIRGTDAHSWVQVYFAGYGWVNFEPSASFATFSRPLPNQYSKGSTGVGSSGSVGSSGIVPPGGRGRTGHGAADDSSSASTNTTTSQAQVHQEVFMTVSGVILLLLFGLLIFMIWWRRLFRRYSLAEQLYGRVCLLANWAGIQLKPSQTPYEYLQGVAASAPQDALIIERLGDIYVRDKWANPESSEHPLRSGEIDELPSLWRRIQPHLFLYVVRHPSFLRWLPRRIGKSIATIRRKRRLRKMLNEDL